MGKSRIEEVTCAICYDPLFTKRDDLDDPVPIATCDCGHVFHEPCILEWFHTQSEQYLAGARDQGLDGRYGSPSLSDAPAECPTCRTECFADPETGQPSIHRLFIDFGVNEHSNMGSSPPPSSQSSKYFSKKGKEVLGLARRAKGIREEVKGLNAESEDDEMEGMIRRGEGLTEDLVGIKVLDTVQTYIDNLTKEIKNLRHTLQTNPLIPNLRAKLAEKETELTNLHRQSRLNIQRETKRVKEEEQARCERRVQKAVEERDIFQREYEREKVQRKAGIRAMEERENDLKRKLEEATEQLKKETETRRFKETTLQERNKQLKMFQKKVEDRKELKSRIASLEAENAQLRSSMLDNTMISDVEGDGNDERVGGDESVQEISRSHIPSFLKNVSRPGPSTSKYNRIKTEDEDSLQVDMPSFYDDSLRSPSKLLPSRTTMKDLEAAELDLDDDSEDSPSKHTRQKQKQQQQRQRMHPTARTIAVDFGGERRRSSSSKYFPGNEDEDDEKENHTTNTRRGSNGTRDRDEPSPLKRSKTNPFMTTKASNEKRKELPSVGKMSSSKNTGNGISKVNQVSKDASIIDLATSSPESSPRPRRRSAMTVVKRKENQRSVVDMLELADGQGRPKKGVVSGQKVRRMV
ncbi:hypothetical protein L486_06389 [Kwoniella mangroviensis CBS 10435]|uniref:RING-type domain-containing protein n=1 Tax=Kwoniella mangroviensis CBS 10435 TaxID=1331196 RepID=A0A1B9ILK5_9TREE|nr:uncharacterized protein I203_08261 [Kwoniella mangroviensis CBS 8507]OCF56445.1 hypothetical protein L486_06389 [Kwoniella mangroviensis CBS 10435]OCF62686.1 hypothetical protein I203_08261 [Kwoniella mangroviensis CBS 8507]